MDQNNQNNGAVWISREEYDRLRQTAANQSGVGLAVPSLPAQQPATAATQPLKKSWASKLFALEPLLLIGAVLVLLALMLDLHGLYYIVSPLIAIFLMVGTVTFLRYHDVLKQLNNTAMNPADMQDNARMRKHVRGVLIIIASIVGAVIVMPVLGFVVLILVLMFIGGSTGS